MSKLAYVIWDTTQDEVLTYVNRQLVLLDGEKNEMLMSPFVLDDGESVSADSPLILYFDTGNPENYVAVQYDHADMTGHDVLGAIKSFYSSFTKDEEEEVEVTETNEKKWFTGLLPYRDGYVVGLSTFAELNLDSHVLEPGPTPSLRSYQTDHFERMNNILSLWHVAADNSPMGRGKTYIACMLAHTYGYKLCVYCPKSAQGKWQSVAAMFKVELVEPPTSYHGLAGTTKYPTKTTMVRRIKGTSKFRSTKALDKAVADGIIFVFDESHYTKNKGPRRTAGSAIIRRMIHLNEETDGRGRALLLSATPADKVESAESIALMMGLVRSSRLYHYDRVNKYLETDGVDELARWCSSFAPDEIKRHEVVVIGNTPMHRAVDVVPVVMKLVAEHAVPLLSSSTEAVDDPTVRTNTYFKMGRAEDHMFEEAIQMLKKAVGFQDDTGVTVRNNFGQTTRALQAIERVKTNIMIRQARKDLTDSTKTKVILYFNYIEGVDRAMERLADFNPARFDGTNAKNREAERLEFQEDSDKRRLLIGTTATGAESIDLDDKHGGRPRVMYIVPDYRFIPIHQASGRIFRGSDTKSLGRVHIVYGVSTHGMAATEAAIKGNHDGDAIPSPDPEDIEIRIIDALARKSQTTRDFLKAKGGRFPGDYPKLYR